MATNEISLHLKCNTAEASELVKTSIELANENMRLRAALTRIARWHGEFPSTGEFWPDGTPVSYAVNNGSNGERDYMRQVALDALSPNTN